MKSEDRSYIEGLNAEIRSLWEKYEAVRGADDCAEERWLTAIQLRMKQITARLAPPAPPTPKLDWWCVWCQRVSNQPEPSDGLPLCMYSDCKSRSQFIALYQQLPGPIMLGVGVHYIDGANWVEIRQELYPDLPEIPKPGVRYDVPEIVASVYLAD
ncbi:hypothetical protein CCAX7_47970 [Capsulimonas corticalis]|uniref:Uncharacterized protein n=1 Tax=Capsulimonas corticalis TaxID=2219043 RepID=A0A402CQH8_9BACT|nr:hypothetical protein [Capsulimonas corticalis]BDI32746.1 hypothetical protein CCAX7_47970 [Capsulimonas corticalis]